MKLELPDKKNVNVGVRLDAELKRELDSHAKKLGYSSSTVVRAIVKAYFDEQRRKK